MTIAIVDGGVVVAPHPDDAVLSAWTILRSPVSLRVVTVCAGLPAAGTTGSFDPVFGYTDSRALMVARRAEDEAALAELGRESDYLELLEDQYRGEPLSAEDARAALEPHLRDATWLAAPAGIGAHPDHRAVRDGVVLLARDAHVPVVLYADLPYAPWAGWPHWVTGTDPRPHLRPGARWDADLATIPGLASPDDLEREPIALDADEQSRKLEVLRGYDTQFDALDAGPIHRLQCPEVIGYEVRLGLPG